MAPGQLYRASPMSLLYAIAPLYQDLRDGLVAGCGIEDLQVCQPTSLDDFLATFAAQRPRIIGLSATTYGISFARTAARRCKEIAPDTQVIVGGSHVDGLYGQFEGDPTQLAAHVDDAFDVVISGQAECALAAVVRLAASAPERCLPQIVAENLDVLGHGGLRFAVWWREHGELRISAAPSSPGARPPQPLPPREILPPECEYQFSVFRDGAGKLLRTAQVMTYRGCLFAVNPKNACTFCFVANMYQKGDLTHTLSELRTLSDAGYEAVFFDDAIFTSRSRARKAELREVASELRRLDFSVVGFQTRADYLDREVLEILTSAGCRWYCSLGLESTDRHILDVIGKKQSIDDVRNALALLREFGVEAGLYLLFGALGGADDGCRTPETSATAEHTIDFIAGQMDDGVPVVAVLPGVSMILPSTRDARRYQASSAQVTRPVRFDICHEGDPWDKFEGGLGMHAPGVAADLLSHISQYGRRKLGSVWLDRADG